MAKRRANVYQQAGHNPLRNAMDLLVARLNASARKEAAKSQMDAKTLQQSRKEAILKAGKKGSHKKR
jgi:hypothetical protein